VFSEEIAARGGAVSETFHDHQRLFTRSVLPYMNDVRPHDSVQGGVALRMTTSEICLYPYTFRLVCRNGAIIAQTLESRVIGELNQQDPVTTVRSLRESIEACCEPEVFRSTVHKMRSACNAQVDVALSLLPLLSRLSVGFSAKLLPQILDRFFHDGDRSQFGLANAVTAVARDASDPDLRWNLEELGGGIAIGVPPRTPTGSGHTRTAQLIHELVAS
jgi:hypothetical protein